MPDDARQKVTLSASQEKALAALLGGATVTAAADAGGVTRQMVSGWVNRDAVFLAELRNRACELRTAAMARLEAAVPAALDALAGLLDHADWRARIAAADRILKTLAGPRPSIEPHVATPEAIQRSRERSERESASMEALLDSLAM